MAFLAADQLTDDPASNSVNFYVVLDRGAWKIKYGRRVIGPFASRDHAITAAVDAAHESGCLSHASQVLVQGEDGQFHSLWTYGQDPYPPPR